VTIFITMTYSLDFRQKILSIKEQEGLTQAEAAVRFGVGVASIMRWGKCLEPQRTRSKPATKLDMEALKQDVDNYPDGYQYERAARLGVSQRAIGNALKRLNVSYKKNTVASEGGRTRTAYFSGQDKNLSDE
jgi:transposase